MDLFDKATSWKDYQIAKATGLYPYFRPIEESFGTEVVIEGKRTIMAGSNNYLGLAYDPRVREAASQAALKWGSSCSGSRLLNGTLILHEELERRLAKFLGREAAICFSTGFQTNLGAISAIVGRHDIVFADRAVHASIVDGIRLGFGDVKKFAHNDMEQLEKLLANADPKAGKLIVMDGVFSMEGDLADLPHIVELKRKYGARVMVDDAHGMAVLGAHGRGTPEHFGLEKDVDLLMGTFSKSFASLGGVVAGSFDVINYIKHKSRELVFSASITPASVAACLKALDIIEQEPERRARLWEIAEKMQRGFKSMGLDTGVSVTPIVPIVVGDQVRTFRFWRALNEAGVFTNPVITPAVEPDRCMIRTSYQATHTDEQLDRVLEVVEKTAKKLGVIGAERPTGPVEVRVASPGKTNFLSSGSTNGHKNGHTNGHRNGFSIFDLVESLTYRAASTDVDTLKEIPKKLWEKRSEITPQKLWEKRGDVGGFLLEKGASLFFKYRNNHDHEDA